MKLSVKECLNYGWMTFKGKPWFFVQATALIFAISMVCDYMKSEFSSHIAGGILSLVSLAIMILLAMTQVRLGLAAHDAPGSLTFRTLWAPHPFWKFTGAYLLTAIMVFAGFILLIVPGLILATMLMFTSYLVMDRGMGPIEAIKESIRMTKGNRWQIFYLLLALIGINILGFLAVFVGLLVSAPVSLITMAYAYRKLQGSQPVSVTVPEPVAETPATA